MEQEHKQLVIGILAHVDSGKTTLSEALLYGTGTIRKLGRVDHKDAFLDTDALEKARGITIFSKQALFTAGNTDFTLLDTPGHVDFSTETERSLQVLDYAVLVISGTDGVQSHTETLWRLLRRYHVPTFVFVNKMDLPGPGREALLTQLNRRLGDGFVDFGAEQADRDEALALCDERLMETMLDRGSLTDTDLIPAIARRHVFPCWFGSALKLQGVDALAEGLERYTRPEMGKIWTPENRYQAWLRVELAVCEAWNRVGEISDADMETLRKEADFTVDRAFVDRANEIEETTRHDVIAFLTAIEEKVGPVSRFIHLGCTSSDIVDTAGSLLMVEAGELILKAFDRVLAVLKKMTLEHQGLLCMGRTHGIHAEPTSFSLKMAGFYAEFKRDRARFAAALDDMRVGKLSGAVGTYTVLSPEVEAIVCGLLGLKVDEVSTQVIHNFFLSFFFDLSIFINAFQQI